MIPVMWAPMTSRGSWDQAIIEELTSGSEFEHFPFTPTDIFSGAVVVIAGQHCLADAERIAKYVGSLRYALTIVTSDEEALFPVELLPRDARHAVWNQYHDRGMDRIIPIGVPPDTGIHTGLLGDVANYERDTAVFFAGQDTHERRHELIAVMKEMACDVRRYGDIGWAATTGFRQGLEQGRYITALARTRIAPCPSGPHSLDSFRLYEALAAGALPIIETHTPHGDESEFWHALFGEGCPVLWVQSWKALPSLAEHFADATIWREKRDDIQRWWRGYRADLALDFQNTIERLRES